MTTIAWDGLGMVASDSQGTVGNLKTYSVQKGFQFSGELSIFDQSIRLIMMSGTDGDIRHLMSYLKAADNFCTKAMHKQLCFEAMIFTENNCYVVNKRDDEELPSIWLQSTSYSIGSGSVFAMSALYLGMSAHDAVRHACELDIYSGGDIVTYDCNFSD